MKLLFTFFLILISLSEAKALTDSSWMKFEEKHSQNQVNNPVTNKTFNEALKSKQKKNKKKLKLKKDNGKPTSTMSFEKQYNTSSPYMLMRLPQDAIYDKKIIKKGFYLIDDKPNELILYQGNKEIGQLKATEQSTENFNENKKINISVINDSIFKISIYYYDKVRIGYLKINK